LKNDNRDKTDALMLARNGVHTTKKELKKQHSYETTIIKAKNLPVALQRQESVPIGKGLIYNKNSSRHTSSSQTQGLMTKTPKYRK